jgi:glycine/D-amino acid oxidase-like deaminating enzyme
MTSSQRFPFAGESKFTPYWWEAARPAEIRAEVPEETEVAIIGGGYTGLSAALTLARAGVKATLFEAKEIGWGASSRNGGFVGPEWHTFKAALAYGAERAVQITQEQSVASAFVRETVAREEIQCHLTRSGHFRGAMTPKIYDRMGRYLDLINKHMPCNAELVPRADQGRHVGSDLYHGGLLSPDYQGLHPGLYVQGLGAAAARAGARIITRAEVTSLTRDKSGFRVISRAGNTFAKQVLLASDGYTGSLVPALQRRIIPIRSAMIATEPLDPATMRQLMPANRLLAGSQRVVTYYRPAPDGTRILFGGRVLKLGDTNVEHANATHLHKQMTQVFPTLSRTRVTHYWHGQIGFTFDGLPHLGKINGCHYAVGYNGTGVARASWLGHLIARRMLGEPTPPTAYEGLPMATRPLYRGKPWFLPYAILFYELMDRWDQWRR